MNSKLEFAGVFIGGSWTPTSQRVPITNPWDGSIVGQAPLGGQEHLDLAVRAAQSAFLKTRRQAPYERAEVLRRVADAVESRRSDFVDCIVAEAGKPVSLAEAEVTRAFQTFTLASEEARRDGGEWLNMQATINGRGQVGMCRRFPVGIVYGISPFNFPLNLVAHKLAPCLATGNTFILKPAPKTPLTAYLLAEVLQNAGLVPGQFNVVSVANTDAGYLVGDSRVAMTSFTGSSAVGWALKERCGRQKLLLELGGNAAVVIHSDADLTLAARAVATGGFAYAGQSCISVQRVLVQESIYTEFRNRLIASVREKAVAGDPRNPKTIVGPVIDSHAVERLQSWIAAAVSGGARIVTGGKWSGSVLEPTVLESVRSDMDVCAKEAFGPLVTLQPYGEFSQALEQVNDSPYGLQAGVFTRDFRNAFLAFETLEVGGVMINNVPTFRVENMPYGGVKQSGFGREGVRYAMEEMTEPRSLIWNLSD